VPGVVACPFKARFFDRHVNQATDELGHVLANDLLLFLGQIAYDLYGL
jgi:hypothetical protein